jgi:hypothetical protein
LENEMSDTIERIDVLGVMEDAAHALNSRDTMSDRNALLDALEVVAELIEAAEASLVQTRADQTNGLVPTIYYAAHQRLSAALAGVHSS